MKDIPSKLTNLIYEEYVLNSHEYVSACAQPNWEIRDYMYTYHF